MTTSLSNRWFVWTIVFILMVGMGLWGVIQYAIIELDTEIIELATL